MKINDIIKLKRKEMDLTQEQVAEYLGVTTPAVNKWEKGNSYPDITILPALARLLRIDLNTLLSFKDELTDQEIGKFTNDLAAIIDEKGYDEGFQLGIDKIYNYPNCYKLIYSVASVLHGALFMYGVKDKYKYETEIEKLFERVANCDNPELCNHAKSLLIFRYIEREEYNSAQKLIDTLPNISINKNEIQSKLYIKQCKISEASEIIEQNLLRMANEIQTSLLSMLDIALKESRYEDAAIYADKIQQTAEIYELWDFNKYIGHFQLAIEIKDKKKSIDILKVILPSIKKQWMISQSPLYRHIKSKSVDSKMGIMMLDSIIRELETSEESNFLKSDPEFIQLLNAYKD